MFHPHIRNRQDFIFIDDKRAAPLRFVMQTTLNQVHFETQYRLLRLVEAGLDYIDYRDRFMLSCCVVNSSLWSRCGGLCSDILKLKVRHNVWCCELQPLKGRKQHLDLLLQKAEEVVAGGKVFLKASQQAPNIRDK